MGWLVEPPEPKGSPPVQLENLENAIRWAIHVKPSHVKSDVQELRAHMPDSSNRELAHSLYAKNAWKAAAVGMASGLPSNVLIAVPAGVADATTVLRMAVTAASKVGVIFDSTFLDDEDDPWELLIPIFGFEMAADVLRELGAQAGEDVTKQLVRKYLTKETLRHFQRYMFKYFAMKVVQRAVIAKTVPIIGGLIGGTLNYLDDKQPRKREINYFKLRAI